MEFAHFFQLAASDRLGDPQGLVCLTVRTRLVHVGGALREVATALVTRRWRPVLFILLVLLLSAFLEARATHVRVPIVRSVHLLVAHLVLLWRRFTAVFVFVRRACLRALALFLLDDSL